MPDRQERRHGSRTFGRSIASARGDALTQAQRLPGQVAACDSLHCFISFHEAQIRDAAQAAQRRGPDAVLAGVPIAVKDNIEVAGWPTTAGTPSLLGAAAMTTAPTVQRLLDAGAFVAGKANMHELAFGVTSRNAAFGFVGNPLDPCRSAGGSSGGSAAAVASGIVPAALGTDTGGSVRIPAAFCGLVGFRPSTGRYPGAGVVPLAASRDVIGPIVNRVADAALLDAIVTGAEMTPIPASRPLTLGVPRGFLTDDLDPLVERAWHRTLERLRSAGMRLVEVETPGLWDLVEATSALVTRYELRRDLPRLILPRTAGLSAAEFVASITSPDVRGLFAMVLDDAGAPGEADYRYAVDVLLPRMRRLIGGAFASGQLDAWIFPTVPIPAFPLEADREVELDGTPRPLFMTTVRNLQQASLVGMPSLSLPMPHAAGELPCGLCVEGLPGQDRLLLASAAAIEAALDGAGGAAQAGR